VPCDSLQLFRPLLLAPCPLHFCCLPTIISGFIGHLAGLAGTFCNNFQAMKLFLIWGLTVGLIFYNSNKINALIEDDAEQSTAIDNSKDKREIQLLIRLVLNWANSKEVPISLLPIVADNKGRIHFDLNKHERSLQRIKKTSFFSANFINNYNQIILTLNKGLKHGRYGKYLVGELPAFSFVNGADPWCMCQDVPYDKPNPWNFIEIEVLNLGDIKGELNWKWGRLAPDVDPDWKKFRYKFKVVKENSHWKIAYLQGFDFKQSTEPAGRL
jgi:hypothetical protein